MDSVNHNSLGSNASAQQNCFLVISTRPIGTSSFKIFLQGIFHEEIAFVCLSPMNERILCFYSQLVNISIIHSFVIF